MRAIRHRAGDRKPDLTTAVIRYVRQFS